MLSSDNYKIENINHSDYIKIIKLYKLFHSESHARDTINFSPDATIHFLNKMLEWPSVNFASKCTYNDNIIGFFMGSISNMDFSSTPIGFERGFYVVKESRGSRAAYQLNKAWCNWLIERGVKPLITTVFHSNDNELTYQFCEKIGMREVGKVFERVL